MTTRATNNEVIPSHPTSISPFSYGFTVKGIARATPNAMRAMLSQNVLGTQLLPSARSTVTKEWIVAQMRHYDIQVPNGASKDALKELLASKIREGWCDRVPTRILKIEETLRRGYERKQAAHSATVEPLNVSAQGRSRSPEALPPRIYQTRAASRHANASMANSLGQPEGKDGEESYSWVHRQMQKHHQYVAKCKRVLQSRLFSPTDAVGAYFVQCKDISEGWADMDRLTMNIIETKGPTRLVAEFDFGVLEGMMRLAIDQSATTLPCLGESEEEREGGENDKACYRGAKRKPGKQLVKATQKRKRVASGPGMPPRRLYFRWCGRETGELEIQDDEDDLHVGYLDFDDPGCTTFRGVADLEFVGENIEFFGFKLNNNGGRRTKSWKDYDEYVYR